eukprot:gene63720-87143_t
MNKYLQTIVVAPVTSTSKAYPTRIEFTHTNTSGWIVLDQIRTIDRQRIIKVLDELTIEEIQKSPRYSMNCYIKSTASISPASLPATKQPDSTAIRCADPDLSGIVDPKLSRRYLELH